MENHRGNKKVYFGRAAIVLLVIFLLSGGLLLLKLWERGQGYYPDKGGSDTAQPYLEKDGKRYVPRENVDTFLVLGLDTLEGEEKSESYNNDKNADFLLLLVFDHTEKKVTALQINRDTVTEMNILGVAGQSVGKTTKQIALAHTYGNGREVSCRNTADAVSGLLLGARIEHYMSLTMDSVTVYTDLLGGVRVTVLDDFSGIDDSLVEGEAMTLTGEQALTYVRSRQGLEDSSNQSRMTRQEQVMKALYHASVERMEGDETFVLDAILALSDHMVSDRTVTQLQEIANKLATYQLTDIITLEGETRKGDEYMEFIPDEEALKELVIDLLYEEASDT